MLVRHYLRARNAERPKAERRHEGDLLATCVVGSCTASLLCTPFRFSRVLERHAGKNFAFLEVIVSKHQPIPEPAAQAEPESLWSRSDRCSCRRREPSGSSGVTGVSSCTKRGASRATRQSRCLHAYSGLEKDQRMCQRGHRSLDIHTWTFAHWHCPSAAHVSEKSQWPSRQAQ